MSPTCKIASKVCTNMKLHAKNVADPSSFHLQDDTYANTYLSRIELDVPFLPVSILEKRKEKNVDRRIPTQRGVCGRLYSSDGGFPQPLPFCYARTEMYQLRQPHSFFLFVFSGANEIGRAPGSLLCTYVCILFVKHVDKKKRKDSVLALASVMV